MQEKYQEGDSELQYRIQIWSWICKLNFLEIIIGTAIHYEDFKTNSIILSIHRVEGAKKFLCYFFLST